jgi:tetratricopeptide (TPR) repeat protein
VDRSQAWISRYLQEQNEKPFFLFMHFYDPHMQYAPPPPFNKIYADDLYGGEVAYVDSEIGRFIQSLQEQGLFDDAWIIVLGDHGEGLMDHGEHTHGLFLYEEAVRVPLIIKPPVGTHLKTNTTVTPSVSIADIMPTLIELCQLGAVDTSGKSLVPWLEGKKTDEDRAMVTETLYPLTYNWSPLYSLRTNTWKYIHAPKPELYDLRNDPKEKKNVIAEHPSRTQSMKTELEQALVEYGRNKPFTPDINVSAGNAEILASLGYVGGGSTETDDAALFGDTVKRADPKDRLKEYIDIDIALQMVMENDYYNALKIFNSVLKTDPGNPSAITNIGMVYSRMGNYNTAIKYAQNAVTQAPDNIMIQLQLSQLYIYTNQAALAREILLPLAQAHPKLTDVHFQLGDLALREKKPEEALTYFEKIKTWRPDLPGLDEKIQSIKDSL